MKILSPTWWNFIQTTACSKWIGKVSLWSTITNSHQLFCSLELHTPSASSVIKHFYVVSATGIVDTRHHLHVSRKETWELGRLFQSCGRKPPTSLMSRRSRSSARDYLYRTGHQKNDLHEGATWKCNESERRKRNFTQIKREPHSDISRGFSKWMQETQINLSEKIRFYLRGLQKEDG